MRIENNIEIKPLSAIPEYAVILAQWSYNEWYLNRSIPLEIILRDYKNRAKNEHNVPYTLVAVAHNMPVGMVSLKENNLWTRKDINPWLASLYVMPDYRNVGIASLLLTALNEESKERGFTTLYLFLGQKEQVALEAFYWKRNWLYLEDAIDNDGYATKIFYHVL